MITEDYVSFETANLLKEKGFNEKTHRCYNLCTKEHELSDIDDIALNNWELADDGVSAPTLQMTMKWLREVHKLFIDIFPWDKPNNFLYNIYKIHDTCLEVVDNEEIFHYNTYEEAAEAVIKHCLENLV